MKSIDNRIAKLEAAAAEKRAALEAEKERLAKVAALDQALSVLREKKATVQAEIDAVKAQRDALVPHRAKKVAP